MRDFIHEKFGIYLKDDKISFVNMKLKSRVVNLGLNSFNEYFNYVKYGPGGEKELSKMISLLTNNETYFFRELPQLKVFGKELLPKLRERKLIEGNKKVRVISAGCSTGEEVYTLAMIAFETGSFFWEWDLKIIGMDISIRAIETAKRAVYYPRSLRMTKSDYVEKFFSKNSSEHYTLKNNIKNMTSFIFGNITDPVTWKDMDKVDIIFCRNVLIYFSEEKVKAAVENFYNALNNGGYLLLGHSETLTGIFDEFEMLRFPDTFAYRKKEG